MTTEEAAEIISITAEALRTNPSDFNVSYTATGMQATGGDGAPGVVGVSYGGGVGVSATASTGNTNVMQGKGEFTTELAGACDALQELAEAAREKDKSRIEKLLAGLRATAVIPVSLLAATEAALRLAHLIG